MSDLMISFSGGKTSAYMTSVLLKSNPNAKVVFANTEQEHFETMKFIKNCIDGFKWDVIVLETKVNEGRKSSTYTVKDYNNMSMRGEPFEEVIKKYGIPNHSRLHCTRELKAAPIHKYAK